MAQCNIGTTEAYVIRAEPREPSSTTRAAFYRPTESMALSSTSMALPVPSNQ